MHFTLSAFQGLFVCLHFWSVLGVNTDGSTCSWGIRRECGVASRGVPSLLFNVIATILSFFPVFQNAMQAVTVTGVCIVSREQHNHFDIQLFYLIWRDGTTPFWFRIQPVVTHFFFSSQKNSTINIQALHLGRWRGKFYHQCAKPYNNL